MIEINVLNKNLERIGIIDSYKSVIWANRYRELGDCELYLGVENLDLLQIGNYLARDDDETLFRIDRIEIDTDAENGNYLIVKGTDVKVLLDQRIFWDTVTADGNAEDFLRAAVSGAVCEPTDADRQMKKENGERLVYLGSKSNLTEAASEQISYVNIGEKIREYCQNFGWGYRMNADDKKLYFQLYSGTDRSDTVVFSDDYENLSSTQYTRDSTNLGNVALIGGAGEGSERTLSTYGSGEGIDRYEVFVDGKDKARNINWSQLIEIYPTTAEGGQGHIEPSGDIFAYEMNTVDVQILDAGQLSWLQTNYPSGSVVTVDGNDYYRVPNVVIATLETDAPADNTTVILEDIIYMTYLLSAGEQALADYGTVETFEGSIIPDVTFIYKQDYFLGDIVKVQNEYGISANARIIEVVEVQDENGYSVEPKFEYLGG